MKIEKIVIDEKRNVVLTAMIQDVGGEYRTVVSRPAVVPSGRGLFILFRQRSGTCSLGIPEGGV